MLCYKTFPVTAFAQNASLVWCDKTHQAAFIDPGGDGEMLAQEVQKRHLTLTAVLLTHGHLDHVGAALWCHKQFDCPIIGPHEEDQFLFDALPLQAQMFGFPHMEPFLPDQWLDAGRQVTIGQSTLDVRHCPGHTPGHIVFVDAKGQRVWGGDVLFAGSIGRTDLPGGSPETLLKSIHEQLLSLDDAMEVVPGHGPNTTIEQERRSNPFLQSRPLFDVQ